MPDVVGVGQCSLDLLGTLAAWPAPDSKIELPGLAFQGGGPVATALVTLARLGVSTALQAAVGDDAAGGQILEGLAAEGVDSNSVVIRCGGRSQVAFIAVEPATARRTIFWHRGDAALSLDDLDAGMIRAARVLHLDGLHQDVALEAARIARAAGVTTVLDGGTLRPGVERLLPCIDHAVVSCTFAEALAPDPFKACEALLDYGARAATVTLGERGSVTRLASGELFQQGAFQVEVLDTTGCGDVFHGAYIFALLHNWSWPLRLAFAAACAALKTRALGGRAGIPDFATVSAFLAGHGVTIP